MCENKNKEKEEGGGDRAQEMWGMLYRSERTEKMHSRSVEKL
jgi:hypothetical protein